MALSVLPLTPGETMFANRKLAGRTQAQEAKRHRVGLFRYQSWELGTASVPFQVPKPNLTVPLSCVIIRRRFGLTAEQVARMMGCSLVWVRRMENGTAPHTRLVSFWTNYRGQHRT